MSTTLTYIPLPGTTVRLVEIHPNDLHYGNRARLLGKTGVVESAGLSEDGVEWARVTFGTGIPYGPRRRKAFVFYGVKVEVK